MQQHKHTCSSSAGTPLAIENMCSEDCQRWAQDPESCFTIPLGPYQVANKLPSWPAQPELAGQGSNRKPCSGERAESGALALAHLPRPSIQISAVTCGCPWPRRQGTCGAHDREDCGQDQTRWHPRRSSSKTIVVFTPRLPYLPGRRGRRFARLAGRPATGEHSFWRSRLLGRVPCGCEDGAAPAK